MHRDVTYLVAALVLALAPLSGLAACSGGASAWSGPNAGIKAEPDRGWMSPATKKGTLLYVSNSSSSDAYVAVYTYPKLRLVGKLTGFTSPEGECADAAGDVWIADFFSGNIVEYAHGGTTPIATLSEPGAYPFGCSVDPTSGNLAVTNLISDTVVVYPHASGSPTPYSGSRFASVFYCAYDAAGNLFVDGIGPASAFEFAELPKNANSIKYVLLDHPFDDPGGVAWDGTYVAITDPGISPSVAYRFKITGRHGREISSAVLGGSQHVYEFSIVGRSIVGADTGALDVGIWRYPRGGSVKKEITGFGYPGGTAVSEVPK
jgi:hypothetical protein